MARPGVARRGFGEGSIYPRGDGRWVSYLRMPDGRKKFFSGRTREVVRERLAEAHLQMQVGRPVVGRDRTVAPYLGRWLTAAAVPRLRPTTSVTYQLCV